MGKKYDDYRREIYDLDFQITNTNDKEQKLELIDKNIQLNKEYIHILKKPIPVKIVFCILLSIFFLLGLIIFLPQIIIRKNRVTACERRIRSLENLKASLQQN